MRWRDRLPVLAGTAAGIAAAAALTLLQSSTYRADASIALVRQGQPPGNDPALAQAAEAAADLFHSRAVAEPAVANLRLDGSAEELLDRVSVEAAAGSSLVRVAVEASSRDEARRTVQELAELATVLFNDRFGPATAATVWEAPRADEERVSPKPARNLAVGALAGAIAGWLLGWARERAPRRQVGHAGSRAKVSSAAAASAPVVPRPDPSVVEWPRPASRSLAELERLAASHPERAGEWRPYLAALGDFVDRRGRLPGGLERLLDDVFG